MFLPRMVTGRKESAAGGHQHQQARAQGAQNVHSSTMTTTEEREKGDDRQRTASLPNRRQLAPTLEVSNKTRTGPAGQDGRLPYYSYKKGS